MGEPEATVFVVDDDASVRNSLRLLTEAAGWQPEVFSSAHAFLARPRILTPSCLLLDFALPDINGCDLQKLLVDRTDMPIIFITGHGDVPMTICAMKAGAVDFFTKPFINGVLLSAISDAIVRSRAVLHSADCIRALLERYASLTVRQREVMALVVLGRLNKQVGSALGISEITVKAHRGQVMERMNASSLPDLVRMADRISVHSGPPSG